jgi:hypothetical protein
VSHPGPVANLEDSVGTKIPVKKPISLEPQEHSPTIVD